MRYLSGLLILAAVSAVPGQDKQPAVPQTGAFPVVRLAPPSAVKQVGAFRYRLLPDPLDRTPGNAAPLWRLAGEAFHYAPRKMTLKESAWGSGETPLKDLPRKEVHDFLAFQAGALRLAREAARRERCDWEMPPLTIQTIHEFLPPEMFQRCRELANLLSIQYRLQLVEGRFEDAVETLQTGFTLARHLSESDTLIQNLISIAISAIILGHVEEWVQTPGSPNLYWALTALPRPLGPVRRAFEHELNTFHRSFPRLRQLRRETLTPRQAEELVTDVFGSLRKAMGDSFAKEAETFRQLEASIRAAEMYPQARQYLLDLGRPATEIDAMPKAQVVLLWYVDQYDRARDDVLKALTVPMWQAPPLLEEATGEFRAAGKSGKPIFALLMPAMLKTFEASVQLERKVARLRGAEALRLYAAAHEGKPPAKWSDITAVPRPIDPLTGKGFDSCYQVKDGRGVLDVPAPPGQPAQLGRRYELAPR